MLMLGAEVVAAQGNLDKALREADYSIKLVPSQPACGAYSFVRESS